MSPVGMSSLICGITCQLVTRLNVQKLHTRAILFNVFHVKHLVNFALGQVHAPNALLRID